MSEAKHTPGPWNISKARDGLHDGEFVIIGADQWHVATTCESASFHKLGGQDESEANARLIAAAPDMLATLKLARAALHKATNGDEYCEYMEGFKIIDATIAKAEGRS